MVTHQGSFTPSRRVFFGAAKAAPRSSYNAALHGGQEAEDRDVW